MPADFHAEFLGGSVDEVPHAVLHAGGDDEILGFVLLEHEPLHLNEVLGMSPVALGVEIAEVEAILQAELDPRQCTSDLAGNKGFATDRAFVIEKDAVAGIDAVGFTVIHGDPVGIKLGYGIGAAGIERRSLLLRSFLHQAIKF